MFGRIVEPFAQALVLFLFADMEKKFQQHDAVVGQQFLEGVDLLVAGAPDFLRLQSQHTHDKNVLVMRPVEQTDATVARHGLVDAPEEIVGQFFG